MTVTVAVDANGADLGPAEVLTGAAAAVAASGGTLRVRFYADTAGLTAPDGVELVHAPVSIAKAAEPAAAARSTPEASVVQAARALAGGEADALVSGGSTGAALAASLFHVKRARGIHRPALAMTIPVPEHPFLLLDVGANVAVRPEHLVQFAHMGAAYAEVALGITNPRVALLANGTEDTKGTEDVQAAHAALAGTRGFIGNVEGFAVGTGEADVIVTDGFTGNVMLKTMEGVSSALLGAVRNAALASARAKAGGLLLKPALRGLRDELEPNEYGGAVLLGLRKVGVVPHGSFTARGYQRAIEVAANTVRTDVVGRTHARLEAAGALRERPSVASADAPMVPDR
jgi:glycerol-3-phosphate acyltransferase PlsX